jgi:alkylation response protein AidB-like acyl-CoA dehydrogenase
MQAAYDYTIAYLTGQIPGTPGVQTQVPSKGLAVAAMLFKLEAARALFYRAISEAQIGIGRSLTTSPLPRHQA